MQPLIDEYPYLEFNPEKGDALLTAKGWTKNDSGMWQDETGAPVNLEIISFFDFTAVGPVVVEQLKQAGIEATYAEPTNIFDRFFAGEYTGCLFGHGGSYSSDVYYSLRFYQTASTKIPGGHLVNASLWHNEEYDKLVDELYGISPTDMEAVMEIWKKALDIWLPDYPDIQISQGLHRLPMNTTYWTNWPTAENPYVNPAHWHLTWPYVMHMLQPASPRSSAEAFLKVRGGVAARRNPHLRLHLVRFPGEDPVHRLMSPIALACSSSSSGWPQRLTSSCHGLAARIPLGRRWPSRRPPEATFNWEWRTWSASTTGNSVSTSRSGSNI